MEQKMEESRRYVDMSIEELDKEIKDEQEFADSQGVSEWTLKDIEKAKREIKRQEEAIAEKKEEYLESVKINKEYMKKTKKELKEFEEGKASSLRFQKSRMELVGYLKDIRNNLTKDSDFYKEMEAENEVSDQIEESNKRGEE